MTKEELLKPRYKVLEKWPSMRDFEVGQIVVLNEKFSPQYHQFSVEDCQGKRDYIDKFFDDYPHLFEKLEWWEERDKYSMPKYVRIDHKAWAEHFGEFVEVFNWYKYPEACIYHDHLHAGFLIPATEDEYNSFRELGGNQTTKA